MCRNRSSYATCHRTGTFVAGIPPPVTNGSGTSRVHGTNPAHDAAHAISVVVTWRQPAMRAMLEGTGRSVSRIL